MEASAGLVLEGDRSTPLSWLRRLPADVWDPGLQTCCCGLCLIFTWCSPLPVLTVSVLWVRTAVLLDPGPTLLQYGLFLT